jgi:hypothetical protein
LSLIKLGKETNCDLYHYQLKNLKDFLKRSKHAFKEAVNCLGAEERKEWEKDELSLLKED